MAKKKRKRRNFLHDYESFEAPGITIERLDRTVILKTHRTPEQQRAMNASMAEVHQNLPDNIREKAQRFEKIAEDLNTFDLITWISLSNFLTDPETYVESQHGGSSLLVEYATLLLAKHPFRAGRRLAVPEDLREIETLLQDIHADIINHVMTRTADPERIEGPDEIEKLQFLAETHELSVRGPAYPQHFQAVTEKLFGPFSEILKREMGFSPSDALTIAAAISDLMSLKLSARAQKARDQSKTLLRDLKRHRNDPKPPEELRDMIRNIGGLSTKEVVNALRGLAFFWTFSLAGRSLAFDCKDLAEATSYTQEVIENFISKFILSFGDVPSDFYIPTPVHQLKIKPLVTHEGKIIAPVPGLLEWALKPMFEATLQRTSSWNRYVAHRHRFLVNESVRLLVEVLPSAEYQTELHYSVAGESLDAELDAFITVDSAAIFLEAKAGAFTPPAREGHANRLRRDLQNLVTHAHQQAIRAAEFMSGSEEVTFSNPSGDDLTVSGSKFNHIFLISVLLEPLGHLTPHISGDSSILPGGGRHVWTVSLYDLMAISELAEPFPLLLHYIARRLQVIKNGLVRADDELDLFAAYLDRGLFFLPEDFRDLDSFHIGTFTDRLDSYFLHQAGVRHRLVKKPEPRLSPELKKFIRALGESDLPGRLTFLLHLLNMDHESRQRWIRGVIETKRRFRKDGRLHNFTIGRSDGFGLTYFCGPAEDDRFQMMERYCRDKLRNASHEQETGWLAVDDTQPTPGYSFRTVLALGTVSDLG